MELCSFGKTACGKNGGESEVIGNNGAAQHAKVKEERAFGEVGIPQKASDDGVVNEGIWLGNIVEQLESITQIAIFRNSTEFDETTHGVVVGGEAEADGSGVELLKVGHRPTPLHGRFMAAQHRLGLALETKRHFDFVVCRFGLFILNVINHRLKLNPIPV